MGGKGAVSNSRRQDWRTPPDLFRWLHDIFAFTVDAAASADNALLPRFWTESNDGLAQSWQGERVFCNPPHGKVRPWVEKAIDEASAGSMGACLLVPARTEARWFTECASRLWVCFLTPRVNYVPPEGVKASGHALGSCLVLAGDLFGIEKPSPFVMRTLSAEVWQWSRGARWSA